MIFVCILAILARWQILLGNPGKARTKLGWKHQIGFQELVREMMANDLALISEQPAGELKIDRS